MLKNLKKLFSILCVGASIVILASCGKKNDENKPWTEGGQLTIEDVDAYSKKVEEETIRGASLKQLYDAGMKRYAIDVVVDYSDTTASDFKEYDMSKQNSNEYFTSIVYGNYWEETCEKTVSNYYFMKEKYSFDYNNMTEMQTSLLGKVTSIIAYELTYDEAENTYSQYSDTEIYHFFNVIPTDGYTVSKLAFMVRNVKSVNLPKEIDQAYVERFRDCE